MGVGQGHRQAKVLCYDGNIGVPKIRGILSGILKTRTIVYCVYIGVPLFRESEYTNYYDLGALFLGGGDVT